MSAGHPNVKLFLSHGGGMSTNEAIYNGVPVLAIPFFADQMKNARVLTRKGMAKTIEITATSSQEIFENIRSLIDDPRWRFNLIYQVPLLYVPIYTVSKLNVEVT